MDGESTEEYSSLPSFGHSIQLFVLNNKHKPHCTHSFPPEVNLGKG